ncbi:MAG: Holliday junction branch migration protein RuvA [Chloroflexota bacterium]
MIAGLSGLVEGVGPDWLLVNVGGIVYQVYTSSSTLSNLPPTGRHINLHTHLLVREDALTLFGFVNRDELRLFQLLLSVSGVGPRSALSLLSAIPVDDLVVAIASEDTARLSSVTGIGKRTAARIALELKGKVGQAEAGASAASNSGVAMQLLAALTSLGYSNAEAAAAVRSIQNLSSLTLEDALREALRNMASEK